MFDKDLQFSLALVFIVFMVSCTDTGPGNINLAISSISPDNGSVGTDVTIQGSGFVPKASENIIKFNDTKAEVISVNSQKIITKVPPGATSGPLTIEIGGKGIVGPSFSIRTEEGKPSVNNLEPSEGSPGATVTISGKHFSSVASENTVTFADTEAAVSAASTTELTAIVPDELSPGMVSIQVTVDGQTAVAPNQFTITQKNDSGDHDPLIGNISPAKGPMGTEVTISGENFSPTPEDNTVTFNGTEASIRSVSETKILTIVPDDATSGPIAITVDGQTAIGPNYTVTDDNSGGSDAPSIDGITPTEGSADTYVTISGTNFSSTPSENTVIFGGTKANISAASGTEIIAIVPDGLSSGSVAVQVILNGQTATGPDFTITDNDNGGDTIPSIDEITPIKGTVGTEVTINGSDFNPAKANNTVAFGGIEASINSASSTEIVAIVPDGLDAGAVNVMLTTNSQTTTASDPFIVTVPAPVINSVSPERGQEGTEVTITGDNFSATASENTITFDGVQATVTSASEIELVVEIPSGGTTGPLDVLVNGQTATYDDFVVGALPLTGNDLSVETGISGVCLGCDDSGGPNVIDENHENFASIELTLGVGATGHVSIKNTALLSAGGQAGFLVARNGGTLDLGLLGGVAVETYLNGNLQESQSGSNLLLISSSNKQQFIGFETTEEYDEIVITFGALASADILYEIYGVYDDYFVTE